VLLVAVAVLLLLLLVVVVLLRRAPCILAAELQIAAELQNCSPLVDASACSWQLDL